MDTDYVIATSGYGMTGENGVHEQLSSKWEEGISLEKVNGILNGSSEIAGLNDNFEGILKLNDNSLAQGTNGSIVSAESNGLTVSKV